MTIDPGKGNVTGRRLALVVAGLGVLACLAFMPFLESEATPVRDFSATAPIMGRWRLVDDAGLRADGLAVPEWLRFEPLVLRPGEELPREASPQCIARLSSEGREVLIEGQGWTFESVRFSGVSPFADIGDDDGVSFLLSLHDVFPGWRDRLAVGLGPNGLMGHQTSDPYPRLLYARD